MAKRPDARRGEWDHAQFIFTDRTAESDAMRQSIIAVADQLRGVSADTERCPVTVM